MLSVLRRLASAAVVVWALAATTLATAPARAALYFNSNASDDLYQVDPATGASTRVGGYGNIEGKIGVGMTPTANPNVLLASTFTELTRVDLSTGA